MADEIRKDIETRFKKGQSGNPKGRPKGRKNNAGLLSDAFFKTVRIKDAEGFRNVPKIVAATEVCLNNALKGDLRSFVKVMEIAQKFELLKPGPIQQEIAVIRRIIVDPKDPNAFGVKWRRRRGMSVLSSIADVQLIHLHVCFVAQNGHRRRVGECPLSGEVGTSNIRRWKSAFDPGCVKTPTFNLRVEIPSRFCRFGKQLH